MKPTYLLRILMALCISAGPILFLTPSAAIAGDGVIEINQVCATNTGCMDSDSSGYPVTISEPGSYLLTSNLTQPNPNTGVIQIAASDVTVDLGGFAITGGTVCSSKNPGEPVTDPCENEGTGDGIVRSGTIRNVTIRNGTIQGMGRNGILFTASHTRIENLRVLNNGEFGISLGNDAVIINSSAMSNGSIGFSLAGSGTIANSKSHYNGGAGISTYESLITKTTVIANGNVGIGCSFAEVEGCVLENVIVRDQPNSSGIDLGNHSIVRASTVTGNDVNGISCSDECLVESSTIANNGGFELSFPESGGYVNNVIVGTIEGSGVQLGSNLCNGSLCPP